MWEFRHVGIFSLAINADSVTELIDIDGDRRHSAGELTE